MKTVATILRAKRDVVTHTIGPAASMFEALQLMADKNIGAVLVTEHDAVVGIVSERDYARKIILMGRISRDTPVREVMSSPVMYVTPERTTQECMALMTENRLRHLPVLERGKLVGLISIGDLVADIISEQSYMIQQLELYIAGAV